MTIANEVGDAKIGDPYDLYMSGETKKALYAVESWYSWHSRDDYTNNIWSVRNAYYGSLDGSISEKSLSHLMSELDAALDAEVKKRLPMLLLQFRLFRNLSVIISIVPKPRKP